MKRQIFHRLTVIVLISMLVTLGLNYVLQLRSARSNMVKNSQIKLNMIEQILEENQTDIEQIREELKSDYIIRAKAAAYIMQLHPEYEDDLAEMKKIADLLQVDEFHLFDKEGVLYSGSEPKYYGYTFHSGKQMEFFLPMLEDTSLELCQDMMPNTAEGKMMQYVAVWREDKQGIVQIGMQPYRLMEAMEKNELSYIFSRILPENGTVIYAIEKDTDTICGCTRQDLIGKNADETGMHISDQISEETGFSVNVDGEKHYCVFEELGEWYIGVSQAEYVMYKDVRQNMTLLIVYLILVEIVMFLAIYMQINRLIIREIDRLNLQMSEITEGNLDTVVDVKGTEEFGRLSDSINGMVSSLLDTTNKLSRLFDSVDVEMGIYEYRENMKRVQTTRRTAELLGITPDKRREVLADKKCFEAWLENIFCNQPKGMKDIYLLPDREKHYVRIRSFENEGNTFGVILDVTEEILEKQRIEQERDSDMLTGLLSRRAFFREAEQLFKRPKELKQAALVMADVDQLKKANDTYGHAFGDSLIRAASDLFNGITVSSSLAARLSGDEFVLFIYGCDSREKIQWEIDRIYREMLKKELELPDGTMYPVRVSAGYVYYESQTGSLHNLMKKADGAMYQVKQHGKAGFVKYDPGTA